MRRIALWVSTILIVVTAAPAAAQQRLLALTRDAVVEVNTAPGSLGQVIRRSPVPVGLQPATTTAVVAGGSALAWAAPGGGVVLYDTATGRLQSYGVPGFAAKTVLGADPGSFRLLVLGDRLDAAGAVLSSQVLVADLRTGATRLIDVGANVGSVQYAPRGGAVFVARSRAGQPDQDIVIDVLAVDDGSVARQVLAPASFGFTVNELGTRLYVGTLAGMRAYDAVTGELLATNAAPSLGSPSVDNRRGRLMRTTETYLQATLEAFDAESLAALGSVAFPPVTPRSTPSSSIPEALIVAVDASPVSATIYALQGLFHTFNYHFSVCEQATWLALDAATGRIRAAADASAVASGGSCGQTLVRLTEPPAPWLAASVTGRRVSLSWGAEAATHYDVEAGVAPGVTNLTIPVAGTELVIDDVPAGVYHVRVRAVNVIGTSAASQELRVVVE